MTDTGRSEPREVFLTLDARGWEPPEPMMRVLEALDALPREAKIVALLDLEPRPLFRILRTQRFDYRSRPVPAGYFEVRIWRPAACPDGAVSPE